MTRKSDGMEWERCPEHGPLCDGPEDCCCINKHPLWYTQEFVTHASGERMDYPSGMRRNDTTGKPRFDLIMPEGVPFEEQLLTRFAALMARGAEIHGERNWEKANSAEDRGRFRESAFRHFMQWYCGMTDEDHATATWFNMQGVEFVERKLPAE